MASRIHAAVGPVATQAPAAGLTVEMHGIRSDDGGVHLAVHGSESKVTFVSREGVASPRRESAASGTLPFVLRHFVSGRYAAIAFHDENDSRDLDTDLLGTPTEGFAGTDTVAGDQQPLGVKIHVAPCLRPSTPERLHRELRGVVVHAEACPAGIGGEGVDTVGDRHTELSVDEIVDLHLLRPTLRTPFLNDAATRPEHLPLPDVT